MDVSASQVKELRDRTGAGIMDCKRALQEASGDLERAAEVLRQQGLARADKKSGRIAQQGLVDSYIHAGRVGAIIEVNCETDFVARTDDFRQLAHDLAMQVVGNSPKYVSVDEVPEGEKDHADQLALLSQSFIKEPTITIEDLIKRNIAKLGEAIRVRRFVRFELGEATSQDQG